MLSCFCVHTHTHRDTHIHTRIPTRGHTHIHTQTYGDTHIHGDTQGDTHTHKDIHTGTQSTTATHWAASDGLTTRLPNSHLSTVIQEPQSLQLPTPNHTAGRHSPAPQGTRSPEARKGLWACALRKGEG